MVEQDLIATIRHFLIESFVPDKQPEDLPPELNLLRGGVLDSLAIIETASFLESLAGVEIASSELTTQNFGSIAAMANLVNRLAASAAAETSS